jgi:hypothetical protein
MTLTELIEKASSDIDMYKHPDIDECQRRLSEILQAAEHGSIMNDHVESLEIYKDTLQIETSWSTRGCSNSSSYRIPMEIIRAEDPIKAAKIWGCKKRISKYEQEVEAAKRSVKYNEEILAKYKAELEAIML